MSTTQDSAITSDVKIDMLPDDVLLKIFVFYVDEMRRTGGWHPLVHVCQKWRNIALGSPYHLNLQLVHTEKTPIKEILEVWPPLPIVIKGDYYKESDWDDLIATLEHNDRVCEIRLWYISSALWERVSGAMQVPFPALTDLDLLVSDTPAWVVPDSFLGGSAPRLHNLALDGASFLGLPKLVMSTPNLVKLILRNIPHSGYISPEAMVDCVSTLTRLKELELRFKSPQSRPDHEIRRSLLLTRALLPTLTDFYFYGVCDYLEDFVARIDTPLLNSMGIDLFHQTTFETPQLAQFIGRVPHLRASDEARIFFSDNNVSITLPGPAPFDQGLDLEVPCRQLGLQLAFVAQACSSSFPQALITTMERLCIIYWPYDQPDNIEDSKWLELLRPFTNAKGLYLSRNLVPCIAATLQGLSGEKVIEVLPALQRLFVKDLHPSGSDREAFEPFIAARRLSGHPIAISNWDEKWPGDEE